jgi:ribose transport system substrate-binding protein
MAPERAVATWWNLPTSRQQTIVAIAAQNDAMAFGARKALKELPDVRLSNIPVLGCDGLPQSGQTWVQKRILNATTIVPVLAGLAVDLLLKAITANHSFLRILWLLPNPIQTLANLLTGTGR